MQSYIVWFLLAFALLGLEMLSGTFYMIVFSIAAAAGGLMAYLQFSFTLQLSVAALVGVIGTGLLRSWHVANNRKLKPGDQNLDIGHPVQVEAWNVDGTARVHYRGSQWDAELETPDTPRTAPLYITDRRGSLLILSQHKPG
jgi:membrane protein implicated in regulation of membrane protease activity